MYLRVYYELPEMKGTDSNLKARSVWFHLPLLARGRLLHFFTPQLNCRLDVFSSAEILEFVAGYIFILGSFSLFPVLRLCNS